MLGVPVLICARFIPAQAGNTSLHQYVPFRSSVHPRAGGEHPLFDPRKPVHNGSSPRRRGTLRTGSA
ncbi:Hypothetical protein GbCGDNIH4_7230 [Granulibacter bethesdensis CGDNIH4]|nr:Hypothetical protein GbCGDNIH4_7230 [Granulibacter bethesdensis CGDNIH4]